MPASFLRARWLIDPVLGSQLSCNVVPSPLQAGYVAQQGEVTLSRLCHEVEGTCRVPADALPDAMSGMLRSKQLAQVFQSPAILTPHATDHLGQFATQGSHMSVTGGHVDNLADKATAGARNIDKNMVVPLHNSGPPQRPRNVSVKECKNEPLTLHL